MLYKKKQWIEDIDRIFSSFLNLDSLANKTILITGATGLICSAVVDIITRYNDTHEAKITVYAAGRRIISMQERFGDRLDRTDFQFVEYDATTTENIFNFHADYIIHGAGNAYPSRVMKEPVETMVGNFLGLKGLLDFARETNAEKVLYISSSEVYGQNEDNLPYREDEYGYVDILNSRNSYSVGKRAAETLCVSYSEEYGVETVIVRPGHIYGPTASKADNRVSSQWAYSAACGEDIIMKSDGAQIRSYCYCLDCASAILTVLIKGENKHAYNISNPDSIINIRQMAELLAKSAGVQLRMELPTEAERRGFNPMSNSSLDSTKLINLGWKGCFDAGTGFSHTVQIIKETIC